jgi:hypothetical protein
MLRLMGMMSGGRRRRRCGCDDVRVPLGHHVHRVYLWGGVCDLVGVRRAVQLAVTSAGPLAAFIKEP